MRQAERSGPFTEGGQVWKKFSFSLTKQLVISVANIVCIVSVLKKDFTTNPSFVRSRPRILGGIAGHCVIKYLCSSLLLA